MKVVIEDKVKDLIRDLECATFNLRPESPVTVFHIVANEKGVMWTVVNNTTKVMTILQQAVVECPGAVAIDFNAFRLALKSGLIKDGKLVVETVDSKVVFTTPESEWSAERIWCDPVVLKPFRKPEKVELGNLPEAAAITLAHLSKDASRPTLLYGQLAKLKGQVLLAGTDGKIMSAVNLEIPNYGKVLLSEGALRFITRMKTADFGGLMFDDEEKNIQVIGLRSVFQEAVPEVQAINLSKALDRGNTSDGSIIISAAVLLAAVKEWSSAEAISFAKENDTLTLTAIWPGKTVAKTISEDTLPVTEGKVSLERLKDMLSVDGEFVEVVKTNKELKIKILNNVLEQRPQETKAFPVKGKSSHLEEGGELRIDPVVISSSLSSIQDKTTKLKISICAAVSPVDVQVLNASENDTGIHLIWMPLRA